MLLRIFTAAIALSLMLPAGAFAAGNPDMEPAPADRAKYQYMRKPGDFKRDKLGMIDPSPDVISLEYLPKDNYGFVDWTKAMKDGIIAPKDNIKGTKAEPPPEVRDIVIKSKMDFMPDVLFPHSVHTEWLKCSTCHPKIFSEKAGETPITMTGIWQGKFCGRCHDRVAFPTRNCHKCHSVPREARE